MSKFSMFFTKRFNENATFGARSSCHADNTAANFEANDIFCADTVISVSVLLCVLIGIICLNFIGLINLIIINFFICLLSLMIKKQNARFIEGY